MMLQIIWETDDPKAEPTELPPTEEPAGPPLDGRTMRVTQCLKLKGNLMQPRGLTLSSENIPLPLLITHKEVARS